MYSSIGALLPSIMSWMLAASRNYVTHCSYPALLDVSCCLDRQPPCLRRWQHTLPMGAGGGLWEPEIYI